MKYPSYSPPSMFFYCRHNPYQFLDIAVHIFSFVTHDITLLVDCPPNKEPLDWNTRMKIAAGAAKGLEYLHDKANPPVIYRDFKSSNILLGEDYYPKLSDFGLAKLGPVGDKTHVSTRVMGTYGYCAPEYAMTGQLTVKSDVYSFGVVFLELITGRKSIDHTQHSGQQNLVAWVGSTALNYLVEGGECPVISLYVSIAKCLISIKFAGTSAFQRQEEILPTC